MQTPGWIPQIHRFLATIPNICSSLTSMKDMGPVMKEEKATIGAQADGKRKNEVVKSLLA